MGGFLFTGLIIALLASIGLIFFQVPALSVALSAMLVLLAAGYILFDTSRIIHSGETNYVMATVALYVDIYMLFTNLLALLGVFSGDE
jgi:modulator of FtsH protease